MNTDASRSGAFYRHAAFAVAFIVVATVYFAAVRTGRIADVFALRPSSIVLFSDYPQLTYVPGSPGKIVFADGTKIDRDGYGYVLYQQADWERNSDRLQPLGMTPAVSDFPVLITLNPSAFDVSGEPMAVRRAADGKILYQAADIPALVDVVSPLRDGSSRVRFVDGSVQIISAQDWLRTFMRVPPGPPAGFEKMSDDELKKHGFERLSQEEVDKRLKAGKIKPEQVYPTPRVPERKPGPAGKEKP